MLFLILLAPALAKLPTISLPTSLEVSGNGLSSVLFVVGLSDISVEALPGLRYSFAGFPEENPPTFDENSRLFFWTPDPSQVGPHFFTLTIKDPSGQSTEKTTLIKVMPAPALKELPKNWRQLSNAEKYLVGKTCFPTTNLFELAITPEKDFSLELDVQDEADQTWRLIYLVGEEKVELDKAAGLVKIWLGANPGQAIRRDLYEDLYGYFGRIFKRLKSISLSGGFELTQAGIYNAENLVSKVGRDNIYKPEVELLFDERPYQEILNSGKNPLLISDSPTINLQLKTSSGLIWRKTRIRIDKDEYKAIDEAFDLVVVKPFKGASTFNVDSGLYSLSFDDDKNLAFGEHKIIIETVNAYDQVLTKEVYVRVVSMPAQVVGKPMVFPNPFNPNSAAPVRIQYRLTMSANIELVLFAGDASVVMRQRYDSGGEGGKKGLNTVSWEGKAESGNALPNGIYTGVIIDKDENRILEKFRLTIFR